jgi:glycine betaine/proline transport system substrate-binding protein
MTAALGNAIKKDEWVVVTGWTPHWKFARWKLKYLEDPKDLYGGEEYIGTIVRKGLKKDMPKVYSFLDKFNWTPDQMAELMIWNQEEGADPYKNALKWMKENPKQVESWLK